jgi:hypothetical protein
MEHRHAGFSDPNVRKVNQKRAWTSLIWHRPESD